MCSLIKKCIFFTQFRCNQSPLKKFWLWLFVCVHVDSDLSCTPESLIRGVISTAELFQKCVNLTYAHCRLHSVTHTMGVCMTLQFHTHHRVRLNVVKLAAEFFWEIVFSWLRGVLHTIVYDYRTHRRVS